MSKGQPLWLEAIFVLFGAGGLVATWLTSAAFRKVERMKNTTTENANALAWFNEAVQRAREELGEKDDEIAGLKAEIRLLKRRGTK